MSRRRVPPHYLRASEASTPRTLIDILHDSVTRHPDAAAIDDGTVLTYGQLWEDITHGAAQLHAAGIKRGDRVGIQMPSGQASLYIAILSTLLAGAAYVPVDADDPEERAALVFGEADVAGVFGPEGFQMRKPTPGGDTRRPRLDDDAWVIFTSGSTGTPKGVAVTHRNAAAFVDAESRMFVQDNPLGPEDRVLAGLSVAFDASCEEMWLAWAHGACLVPAPRSLVRSGLDLGPWLVRRDITVVSTVPTLAGMWPTEALESIRLLVFGGEACPDELVGRLWAPGRELWNTYGPTEATVVACGAQLHPGRPVSIGLPLPGWDLAVVDPDGQPVTIGEVGELIIGGVGLARYLDREKTKEKYAPLPALGWARAYRTGDHVRLEDDGLYFVGRIDDQVKIGGRRIELGEVEAQVAALDGVQGCCVVVRPTPAGEKTLVAYVVGDGTLNEATMRGTLATLMPTALVPRIHVLDTLPVTTSGKVDKKALPWPLPGGTIATGMTSTEQFVAGLWVDTLGASVTSADADFFSLGGGSLAASSVVARVRDRYPTVAVRDLYDRPRLGSFAEFLDSTTPCPRNTPTRHVTPVPRRTRLVQEAILLLASALRAGPWLCVLGVILSVIGTVDGHPPPWPGLLAGCLVFLTPPGRIWLAALLARLITRGVHPGTYPRGGKTHLKVWAANTLVEATGARGVATAGLANHFATLLGNTVGRGVDLHAQAPVTGLLTLGERAAIEPEVDLNGCWLDGDQFHIGAITIGAGARIGARSTLMPGVTIGDNAHVEATATVRAGTTITAEARWSGSPARRVGRHKHRFPDTPPPRRPLWVPVYALSSMLVALLPVVAVGAGATVMALVAHSPGALLLWSPVGALIALGAHALMVVVCVRLLSIKLTAGIVPVRSLAGWRLWLIERLMDDARTALFPLYAAQLTPVWLRALGAKVGTDVEISTAVMIPTLVEIRDGAFLADDTLIGGYELGGGWMLAGHTRIGKRSFVGNSGLTGPGRKLPKNSLVAVLSSTPKKTRAGSNWLGSPPERMRRAAVCAPTGEQRTYRPGRGVKIARGVVETLRLLAPITAMGLATSTLLCLSVLSSHSWLLAIVLGGPVLMAHGVAAVLITAATKWLCVGRHVAADHPLWSPFVWRNELQDTFVEFVCAPWFLNHAAGSGGFNMALRLLGVRIGPGAWVESYWFPETDLCTVGAGATVGPGTVVQTHLFQDRVMSLGTVHIEDGATLGAHSVALPGARLGAGATVGPGSLVMRGDHVPAHTTWQGNPIEPQ